MRERHISFFWRLLSAFIICGIVPLFLLSVVFTGTVQYVIEKNNYRRAEETIETANIFLNNLINNSYSIVNELASNPTIIEYCALRKSSYYITDSYDEYRSILISTIYQTTKVHEEKGEYQIFIIPVDGKHALSKKEIPEQYNISTYGEWGVFQSLDNSKNKIKTLFSQPHPDNGEQTIAATIKPIFSEDQLVGFVIVDILRKGVSANLSQISGLQSSLESLIIFDNNSCILYSHFTPEIEGSFIDYSIKNESYNIPKLSHKIYLEPDCNEAKFLIKSYI